jgi:hypothetical protein
VAAAEAEAATVPASASGPAAEAVEVAEATATAEAASTVVRIAATREASSHEVVEEPARAVEAEARADPTVRAAVEVQAEARADSTSRAAGAPADLAPNSAAGTTAGSQEEGARLADGNYAVAPEPARNTFIHKKKH